MLGSGDTGGGKENMGRESSLESSSVFGDFNVEMQKVNVKGEGSSLGLLEVLVQVGTVGKVKGKGVHGVKVVEVVHGPVKQPSREITYIQNHLESSPKKQEVVDFSIDYVLFLTCLEMEYLVYLLLCNQQRLLIRNRDGNNRLLLWNCWGLGKSQAIHALGDLVHGFNLFSCFYRKLGCPNKNYVSYVLLLVLLNVLLLIGWGVIFQWDMKMLEYEGW